MAEFSAAAEASSNTRSKTSGGLRARDGVLALEDKAGHAGYAHAARGFALLAHLLRPLGAGQEAPHLVLFEAPVHPGSLENGAVADILALLKVAAEESLHDLILRAALPGKLDQPVRIHGIRRARDTIEDELDALGLAGLLDGVEDFGNPLFGAELGHHVALPVHAVGRHVGVELKRTPCDGEVGGPAGARTLEAPLADVAPGTNRVGDDGDLHGTSIDAGSPSGEPMPSGQCLFGRTTRPLSRTRSGSAGPIHSREARSDCTPT